MHQILEGRRSLLNGLGEERIQVRSRQKDTELLKKGIEALQDQILRNRGVILPILAHISSSLAFSNTSSRSCCLVARISSLALLVTVERATCCNTSACLNLHLYWASIAAVS